MVERRYETFLRDCIKGIRHGDREFYQHLKGTHDLLRDWGHPEYVCLAGLFHSIYGTKFFRPQGPPSLAARACLTALIGSDAEQLVFEFCTGERPATRTAELREIEAANMIDQGMPWPR